MLWLVVARKLNSRISSILMQKAAKAFIAGKITEWIAGQIAGQIAGWIEDDYRVDR